MWCKSPSLQIFSRRAFYRDVLYYYYRVAFVFAAWWTLLCYNEYLWIYRVYRKTSDDFTHLESRLNVSHLRAIHPVCTIYNICFYRFTRISTPIYMYTVYTFNFLKIQPTGDCAYHGTRYYYIMCSQLINNIIITHVILLLLCSITLRPAVPRALYW